MKKCKCQRCRAFDMRGLTSSDEPPGNSTTSVGIVGLDYCGSTLVNNILSGLPNCIGVGESHWIVDKIKNPKQTGRCTECYQSDCPVFTDRLLKLLQDDILIQEGKWWNTIAEHAGKSIVVSGDKRPHHYDRFGIPDKLLFIIKDPRSHIVSWARRKFLNPEDSLKEYNQGQAVFKLTDEQFEEALHFWIKNTRKHISWSIDSGKDLAVISLESFINNDVEILQLLADWLGTENDVNALKYWDSDLHYIGSNHSVKRLGKERYFFKKLKTDKRWESVLSEEQAKSIVTNEKLNYQIARLGSYILGNQEIFHDD